MPVKILTFLCGLLSITLLWSCWELLGYFELSFMRVIPPPSQFLGNLADGDFRIGLGSQAATIHQSILSSFFRVFLGMAIAFVASLLVGFYLAVSVWIRRFVLPIIQILAPIAPIAWIPLALVMLGIGNHTAVFIVFMGVFFTLTIATVQAVEMVPEYLIDTARTLGSDQHQTMLHVVLPYILPHVFTALRLNFIAAWMAVLAAEMTGLRDGLGAIIMIGRNLFDYNLILMGMCLIGVTGFIGDVILRFIQAKFFWWGNQS